MVCGHEGVPLHVERTRFEVPVHSDVIYMSPRSRHHLVDLYGVSGYRTTLLHLHDLSTSYSASLYSEYTLVVQSKHAWVSLFQRTRVHTYTKE
jgi:hypothetical protein